MFKKQRNYNPFTFTVIGLAIALLIVLGYVSNIVTLFGAEALTGEVVARAIGVFIFPLGVIMGFF
jgi:hypothetical protein